MTTNASEDSIGLSADSNNVAIDKRDFENLSINWDVLGLTSVAITLVGAAIFYAAGWIYESRWYAYYGIEVSQLNLPSHQVAIQGVPGILVVIFSVVVSLIIYSARNVLLFLVAVVLGT